VSFEVTWPGHGALSEVDDDVFDFSGRFVVSDATVAFTARNDGADVTYRSNPGGQISSVLSYDDRWDCAVVENRADR
jgi:hypothetical protein